MEARSTPSLIACLLIVIALPAQTQEKIEKYPNGAVKVRYSVDATGKKVGTFTTFHQDGSVELKATYHEDVLDGSYETFHPNGAPHVVASYARGKLSGRYEDSSEDGTRSWSATWGDGKLQGDAKVTVDKKVALTQKWRDGTLVQINGFAPHPTAAAEIRKQLQKILGQPPPPPSPPTDRKWALRCAALRRLQAYRYLCGVPFEGLVLDPAYDDLCDAASEVCEKLGYLTHTPPDPGGLRPGRYEQGKQGAGSSNLSGGSDMVEAVDSFMDDSDAHNIAALGHRRWCLLPELRRTGFGSSGKYSAMWTMDQSAPASKGLKVVRYPPAGFVPADFFSKGHAWSVAFVTGPWSSKVSPKATVAELDEHYVPGPKSLETRAWVAEGGYGTTNCVGFAPLGVEVAAGRRYLATLSLDGGATTALQYVVEFSEPIEQAPAQPK